MQRAASTSARISLPTASPSNIATDAQKNRLRSLCAELGLPYDDTLSKAAMSQEIGRMKILSDMRRMAATATAAPEAAF